MNKMKYAISNIAWPQEKTDVVLGMLYETGISGIEIAPSRVWKDTEKLSFFEINKFRQLVEKHQLRIIGLHSLLYDHPELGLFKGKNIEDKTIEFLEHLMNICCDLGGKFLIFGSPKARERGNLPIEEAMKIASEFFKKIAEKAQHHNVFFCIEHLGPDETDFIDSARVSLELIRRVNHPYFRGHLDAKSLHSSGEICFETFRDFADIIQHFHINEPGLNPIAVSSVVNHQLLAQYLKEIKYDNYVSIEQKTIETSDPIGIVKKSIEVMKTWYRQ